jgi:hypothetical protein
MSKYSYEIDVSLLHHPVGSNKFVAKLAKFYESNGAKELPVDALIGEALGSTEDEARASLREKVQAWAYTQIDAR